MLFGSHAVNIYARPERMTNDVDLMATDAAGLAESLRSSMSARFHIAVRVRQPKEHPGAFRIYQVMKPRNRHLVDIRLVMQLPPHCRIGGIPVIDPAVLAAMKAISMTARSKPEKRLSDRLDLHRLLRALPELGADVNTVTARLRADPANANALANWYEILRHPLEDDEEAE